MTLYNFYCILLFVPLFRDYIHTYIHTNIHTYIHTYVYTYLFVDPPNFRSVKLCPTNRDPISLLILTVVCCMHAFWARCRNTTQVAMRSNGLSDRNTPSCVKVTATIFSVRPCEISAQGRDF